MQVQTENIATLIILTTIVFLIAPLFLLIFINQYNKRKRKHADEKKALHKTFQNELLKSQMEVQEQTLQRVAIDLHDNIGQLLSLTAITLSAVSINDQAGIPEKINSAEMLVKRSIKELRQLSRIIYGEELISNGLADAIRFELEWLNKSAAYTIVFNPLNYVQAENEAAKEIILFRLFQEIINNIIKHATATTIDITLQQSPENLTLSITDNGKGFDLNAALKEGKGMGLKTIHKRASLINGTAVVSSAPDKGTQIEIIIPYP
ncbi:MAG: putative signal transduction histidine kinase [Mucilaginibacter sp.]|nr:putative signal transduction histidine kinase [Mucilaginibacter sp.]